MIDFVLGTLLVMLFLGFDMLLAGSRSAFVNSRLSRLQTMEQEGVARAGLTVRVASEARKLILSLRAAQSLSRFAVIAMSLAVYSVNLQSQGVAPVLALVSVLLVTGIVISLTEFLIENIVLRSPEQWALRFSPLVYGLEFVLNPIGVIMFGMAGRITGGVQRRLYPLVTEEQIMTLVDAGEEEGVIEQEEKAMIYSIFQLSDTLAREIMIPRIDVLAFDDQVSLIAATEELLKSGYSRAPVYSGTIDNIVGLLYAKDLLAAWREGGQERKITSLLREAYFVPEAKKVDDLLAEMQSMQVHMVIVVDEYGGMAGLVTIEDVVEEIFGEIRDEYDFEEEKPFEILPEGEFRFSGGIDLDDVNQITTATLTKETSETLGGFIYGYLGRVPAVGDVVEAGGLHLLVEEVSGRRIRKIRAHRIESAPMEPKNHATKS